MDLIITFLTTSQSGRPCLTGLLNYDIQYIVQGSLIISYLRDKVTMLFKFIWLFGRSKGDNF